MKNLKQIITLLLLITITTNAFGQDKNSHEYLLEHNAIYKTNYKHAQKLFNTKARSICGKISAKSKLTANESNAYLMATYYSWIGAPQILDTKAKRNFIGLYDDDSKVMYWFKATPEQIETEFARLMKNIKEEMKTNESLKNLPMPIDTTNGVTKEETGGY